MSNTSFREFRSAATVQFFGIKKEPVTLSAYTLNPARLRMVASALSLPPERPAAAVGCATARTRAPARRRSGAAQRRGARTHSLARKRVPPHLERFAYCADRAQAHGRPAHRRCDAHQG